MAGPIAQNTPAAHEQPVILVADDSLLEQKYVGRILAQQGGWRITFQERIHGGTDGFARHTANFRRVCRRPLGYWRANLAIGGRRAVIASEQDRA